MCSQAGKQSGLLCMLKGAVIVIADKSAKGEMECATDDDMLPGG